MNSIIGKCEFCGNILNESFIGSQCPDCNHEVNYKAFDVSYDKLVYPYGEINHPSDFIFPSTINKMELPNEIHNKNRNSTIHFLNIIPIFIKVNGKNILSKLLLTWDYNFKEVYAIVEESSQLLRYNIHSISLDNYLKIHNNENLFYSIYTIRTTKESYLKFVDYLKEPSLINSSTYFQLYTSINWDKYNRKTLYEYASVNYLLHLMEICKIGNIFEDIDNKLISIDELSKYCISTTVEDQVSNFFNNEKMESKISFFEDFNPIMEDLYEPEEIYEYFSSLEEGAIAPVSVPLSAAALRSVNVYNKLYDLGYDPSLNIYSKGNITSLCPTFIDKSSNSVCYIECNNNIMKGVNYFNNEDEMNSILEDVYNEELNDSIFIKIKRIPSTVITFITNNASSDKDFLTKIINLKDKYLNKTENVLNNNLEGNSELNKFKEIEMNYNSLYKYKYSHFKLKNIEWSGTKNGIMFIDENKNSVIAYGIVEAIPNDYYIYRDIPTDVIRVITDIEVISKYKNKNFEKDIIELLMKKFMAQAIKTKDLFIKDLLNDLNFKILADVSNTSYFWLKTENVIKEEFTLNEAFNVNKRHKIEEMIYKTMSLLDTTGLNTQYYKDLFKGMKNEQWDKYMKSFFQDKKQQFYLEVLPNKNAPIIKNAVNALEYLKIPSEEYVWFKHEGNKDNPIRTRYKVPVLFVSMRRLQQVLSKKNTFTLEIDKRNMKTGQVTSDNKIAWKYGRCKILLIAGTSLELNKLQRKK